MPQRWVMRGAGIAVAPPAECWAQVTLALVGSDPWRPGRPLTGCAPGSLRHPAKVAFLTCVQAADALMRRKLPIVTAERFAADVARLPRRNGVRAVREVFTYARPRTDSLPETHLRLLLTDAGVKDLVVNHPVTVEGETRYLDLAIPRLMVAAEYDGRHHTSDPGQVAGDIRRRAALHAAGWVTIEALWEDMGSPARLIARFRTIVAAAEARAHH
jgi:very-short-patch-repair endonuclease